ncbi:hypothetical protein ACKWTF_014749 [Chironomus riparius]
MNDSICRLCGDTKDSQSLSADITDTSIKSQLETLKINLDDDKFLPNSVCFSCVDTLEVCSKFAQKVAEVQQRLKNDLLDQLNSVTYDDFEHFELKIERLDENFPKKSTTIERNRGIKMRREVLKYTMSDLFKDELSQGKFSSEIDQMPVQDSTDVLKNIGWFNYEWKCQGCNGIFSNVMDLEKHSMKCIKKRCINSCQSCLKEFPSYSTFLNHIVDRHQSLLKFSCIICSEFHWNFIDLFQHITTSHSEYSTFFCLYCGKFFFTGALLRDHLMIHRPELELPEYFCDICGTKTYKKQILLSHMSRFHLERRFTCECCAFSFKYRAELIQHQQSQHSDECNEECKFCGKKFKNKRKLRRHVRNMHEETGIVLNCEHCGKASKNMKAHKTHMKIHSDKSCFQCTYCSRTFKHSSGFKYHLRIHTGEKPYVCPKCDQKFIDWPNCKKHIRSSHGLTDVKPIQIQMGK